MSSIRYDDRQHPTSPLYPGHLDSEKVLLVAVGSQVYKVGLDVYAPTHSESPVYDPKEPNIIELNNRTRQEKVETSCGLSPPAPPLSLFISLLPLTQQRRRGQAEQTLVKLLSHKP
jgi:hypothetical protein